MIKTRDNYINEQENNSHITKLCYHRTTNRRYSYCCC